MTPTLETFSPEAIRLIRHRFGLTQEEFAPLLGVSVSGYRQYEQGRRPLPGPVFILLRIIDTNPPLIYDLYAAADIEYTHPDDHPTTATKNAPDGDVQR